ncbi:MULTISPECIES: hypothetical protein [Pseudomonas]|uniref:hypothetical protein n=1 Tax=Pseudomonas TaxID=286 RepID=UPI000F042C90|nr:MULTISPECIES: hypothetical protein [Pseudomonas]MBD8614818.1 hypothetical protein [Pseudomonas putida]MBD8681498.1 hypothetical protein [Pseudomonas sp. CFBP 13719]
MSLLTPQIIAEFDALGTLGTIPFNNRQPLYHSGSLRQDSDFKPGEGVWVSQGLANAQTYTGQSLNDFHQLAALKLTSLTMANHPNPNPYYTEMFLTKSSLNVVDFNQNSFANITKNHFSNHPLKVGAHELTKRAMIEWAKLKGYDLIIGTNGGKDEVVVVDPESHLTVTYCKDLVTGIVFTPTPASASPAPTVPIAQTQAANSTKNSVNPAAKAVDLSILAGSKSASKPATLCGIASCFKKAVSSLWKLKNSESNPKNDDPSP